MKAAPLLLTTLLLGEAAAADWPVWRGPSGIGPLVAGAILFPVGMLFNLGSIQPWLDGFDLEPGSGAGRSAADQRAINLAAGLTAIGFAMTITGIVLLAVGSGQRRTWKQNNGLALGPGGLAIRF